MGSWFYKKEVITEPEKPIKKIENVDVVKVKLKLARDNINQFIKKKQTDITQINSKINQKIPQYQKTGNKKLLVPLLQAKKDIQKVIDSSEIRLKLVNQKLSQVQIQQVNIQTINVLDDSNKYISQIQNELQKKDWKNVLEQAQNKVNIEWPQEQDNLEEDQTFKSMWKQIGGDKIPASKIVKVNISDKQQQQKQKQILA